MRNFFNFSFNSIFFLIICGLGNVWSSSDAQECSTDTSGLYLDIMFILDISEDAAIYDIQRQTGISLQFILTSNLSMDNQKLQSSRVALITASDEINVIGNFSTFSSSNDLIGALENVSSTTITGKKLDIIKALNTAESIIKETGRNSSYKKLVILFSSHEDIRCDESDQFENHNIDGDICRRAADFKNEDYFLMTVRLDYEGKNSLNKNSIASPCYSLDFDNNITKNMLHLASRSNCFCERQFHQFEDIDSCIKTSECLYLEDTPSSYVVAENIAKLYNATLVDIRSDSKQKFLLKLTNQSLPIFIGLNQLTTSNIWQWDTGYNFNPNNDYNQFAPGEIDKIGMCGSLEKDFKWYGVNCSDSSVSQAYVYQKKACDTNNFC